MRHWWALILLVAACGGESRDRRSPRMVRFAETIAPILDRRCGGCHGLDQDSYARHRPPGADPGLLRWPVDRGGRLTAATHLEEALVRVTGVLGAGRDAPRLLDPELPPEASILIAAPTARALAARRMHHPEVFVDAADPDLAAMIAWVRDELGDRVPPASTLPSDSAAAIFGREVMPVLERRGCLGANCHGPRSFSDLKLEPLVPGDARGLARARAAMLGEGAGQVRMVALEGPTEVSRQLAKLIPLEAGGILHKGGNQLLAPGDPDHATLRRWLDAEARELRAELGTDFASDGLVFVRRPRATPERALEVGDFLGGAALLWRRGDGREVDLTSGLSAGPLDVRSPSVSYDGRRVAVAVRRGPEHGFDVWEIELATGEARQLTFSTGAAQHFLDPVYVPDLADVDGLDLTRADVALVSNLAGERAAVAPEGVLGEAEGGTSTVIADDERFEPAGAFAGRRLRVVRGAGAGAARLVRASAPGRLELDRALPVAADRTTHYVIEAPARTGDGFDLYRLPRATPGEERAAFAGLRRMTHAAGVIRQPSMRTTGEIMMTATRAGVQSGRPFFNGAIFRVHHDGSNFHTHFGNRSYLPVLADNEETAAGLEVHVGRDTESWWGGQLVIADHQLGPAIERRNPLDDLDHPLDGPQPQHSLHRFARSWVEIDAAARPWGLSPGGAYRDPAPLPDGSILVAYAPGPIDLADPAAAPDFDIVRITAAPSWQTTDGLGGGGFNRETVLGSSGTAELWPRPVAARRKEPFHKALKFDVDRLGPATSQGGVPGFPEGTPAIVQVFDLILLEAFFEQNAPGGGRHLRDVTCVVHGEPNPRWQQVQQARIVGLGAPDARGERHRFVLADLPLAPDASFQVLVPPRVSFDVQAVSRAGLALSSPERWLYTLPGEKHTLSIPRNLYAQTCEGCHGALNGRPTPAFGRPDVVSSASRTMAMWSESERKNLEAPAATDRAGWVAVGWDEDIAPLVAARCVSCHASAAGAPAPVLDGAAAGAAIGPYVGELAIRSRLAELLLATELDAPGAPPAHPATGLSRDELATLLRWLDLGAPPRRAVLP